VDFTKGPTMCDTSDEAEALRQSLSPASRGQAN